MLNVVHSCLNTENFNKPSYRAHKAVVRQDNLARV